MVHPALLIIIAPTPNKVNIVRSGRHAGDALKAIDQPQGQNNRNDPGKEMNYDARFK